MQGCPTVKRLLGNRYKKQLLNIYCESVQLHENVKVEKMERKQLRPANDHKVYFPGKALGDTDWERFLTNEYNQPVIAATTACIVIASERDSEGDYRSAETYICCF